MTTRHCRPFSFAILVALSLTAPSRVPLHAATPCESLASLKLPDTSITLAEEIAQGAFTPAGVGVVPAAAADVYAATPAFCRVMATAKPTSVSDIKIEVWLPKAGWNGKFQGVGNGGWAGTLSHTSLAAAVAAGYAAAATDTGHSTTGASFALGNPEKLVDYAHRSLHEMAVHAKAIAAAHYGTAPSLALWNGCSTGGNQGLTIASKYPEDFDAIIAGASPEPRARLMGVRLLINRLVHRTADSYIPPEKYPAIHRAVLDACDTRDGAKDGVIENPRACDFDFKVLACKDSDGPNCLTGPQIETAQLLYSDVKHPKTGQTLYPPLLVPGSELAWGTLAGPQPFQNAVDAYKFLAHKNPDWDPRTFDTAADLELIDRAAVPLNTVTNDLRPFFKRGGKLLMYHGWNDRQVPAMSSVTHFERVLAATGRETAGASIQLYMVPGMDHCRGGAGADTFDKVAAIEQWVSTGRAPDHIVASRLVEGKVVRTRPLCPHPQIARYNGTGSIDEAANFSCVAPALRNAGQETPKAAKAGMTFVDIRHGTFMMGSDKGEKNERPVHKVTITAAFEMQDTETTQAQWDAEMSNNPSKFPGADRPVDSVTWDEAHEFIGRLNARNDGYRYRLPTEAEWEYAARAGSPADTASEAGALGYHTGNSGLKSYPVRTMAPNAWGLYDTRGNVWEWVSDVFDDYQRGALTDPQGPERGKLRAVRGGGWHSTTDALRSTFRLGSEPTHRNSALGFRLVRTRR